MYLMGARAMLPITPGIIPFGLVMGTLAFNSALTVEQTMSMNFIVFAGASQLAAIDLMTQNMPSFIVVITGLIINLRFMLYSASMSIYFQKASFWKKLIVSYSLTDQSYASVMANEHQFKTMKDVFTFNLGTVITMLIAWHGSVFAGFIFGNFVDKSLSLEYAIPLSFLALVIPTLKNKNYIYVAILTSVLSIILKNLPFNLGLLASAIIGIFFGAILTKEKSNAN